MNDKSVQVIVIGEKGNLRNPSLEVIIKDFSPIFVNPFYVSDHPEFSGIASNKIMKLISGRALSLEEIGCAISHRIAIQKSLHLMVNNYISNNRFKWSLILEDDTLDYAGNLKNILSELDSLELKKATLINFYSDQSKDANKMKVSKTKMTLKSQRYWRPATVSYAINKAAVTYLSQFDDLVVASVADWPPYFARVNFYVSNMTLSQLEGVSVIGNRPNYKFFYRLKLYSTQLFNLPTIATLYRVGKFDVVRVLIYYPILRDCVGRIKLLCRKSTLFFNLKDRINIFWKS
jgi:hypothetical protein